MIKVIGKVGCDGCIALKEKLINDSVEFEYVLYEDLNRSEKRIYADIIRSKNNGHFPLVVDENNEIIDIK